MNLGLVPSSEDGWPVACRLLNRTAGGILHLHQNVTSSPPGAIAGAAARGTSGRRADREAWRAWADHAAGRIAALLEEVTGARWTTNARRVEGVKSYAPRVHHVVLDLECRPS